MLYKKLTTLVRTDDETWEECVKTAINFNNSTPLLVKIDQVNDDYYDGEKVVDRYINVPVYGFYVSQIKRLWESFDELSDDIMVIDKNLGFEFSLRNLPFFFMRQYPFIQRKPF